MEVSLLHEVNVLKDKTRKVLEVIHLTRFIDEKMSKLVRQNKGGTFHMPVTGHELIGAVSALTLVPHKDWGFPYYRDRAFAIGLGCDITEILAAFMARELPHHSGGRMMPDHFSHKALRIPCQSSVVGSQFLQAAGIALGVKLSFKDEVVYVSSGEGATSQGDFHEALNFASLHKLPLIFVIQDNGWAISVPLSEQTAGGSVTQIARGFSQLYVEEIDGSSYEETSLALEKAVERARFSEGPSLIVAKVPRICAHSSSDDPLKYKTEETIEEEKRLDPVSIYEKWLINQGIMSEVEIGDFKKELYLKVEEAAVLADQFPHPDPQQASSKVFKEVCPLGYRNSCSLEREAGLQESVVMVDALNHALHEEMAKDPSIIVFGQDVAKGKGGVFGVTRHLTSQHGEARCFNSPLAESTIVGVATGLSMGGVFKPVVEVQFADYLWTGINQLFNELSSIHYRSNGEWHCPLVVRMPCGGYIQGGPYHSQNIEGFLAHCPGLKIVIPSNAADAKRLLKASIRDPNPVLFFEHKALYRQRVFSARKEPFPGEVEPLGVAKIVREGKDLTVVSWGMGVCMSAEIADQLLSQGIHVELIDLCTIVPFDLETVITSLQKTGKLLVVQEASVFGGFGGEIAALVMEHAFEYLDAPVMRIGAKHCPVPYSKILEDVVLPQKKEIEKAIQKLYAF